MKRIRDNLRAKREHTDASLVAERASAEIPTRRFGARARRITDDLIEHGRILADERLMTCRAHADDALLQERAATAPASARGKVDEERLAERAATDILLCRERQRADAAVETLRQDTERHRRQLLERRFDTNEKLCTERGDADCTVNTLEDTKTALAVAEASVPRHAAVLGMVSHDLRSPLCVIAIDAQNIIETTDVEATRDLARDIRLAAARMERLVMDLVDVARIESGALRVVKSSGDVRTLLMDLQRSYEPLFAEHGMTFDVAVPRVRLVASFDHDRIVQVLSNLLSNAMKFSKAGGTVRLEAERRGECVELLVRDDGPGISAEAQAHIFEQFWQIDSNTRRGLGLGLFICEKIVRAHDGHISVESVLGQGATFRFTLPLAVEHALS